MLLLASGAPAAAAQSDAPERLRAGLVLGAGAPAPPSGITAAGWLVADLDTGEILAAKDASATFAPASTLKVLTALALLPKVPPQTVVVPTQSQVDVEGSKVGLLRDVPYPAEELYAALLMVSGNDAANALAGAAGGPEAAAALMNAEARRLGAVDTRAVNPHGLDAEGQVSSPYDLALIAREAMRQPDIARWVATRRGTITAGAGQPRLELVNHNKLLTNYDGALGVKNGYTSRAQASFVGAAERDGRRLVVTLMRAQPRVWAEAAVLLDWGFAALAAGAEPVAVLSAPPAAEPAQDQRGAAPPASAAARDGAGPSLPAVPVRPVAGVLLLVVAVAVVRPAPRPVAAAV